MSSLTKILLEEGAPASYKVAAAEFQKMYEAICGEKLSIVTEDDNKSDLIVIGGSNVNIFVYDMLQEKVIDLDLCYGTDGFHILSAKQNDRNLLFLCGGCGRSTIYAVYHYFETQANCRYFWDGDIIPKAESVNISGINIVEKPRLQYRGIRYFAHRSLHRFQPEHWGFEDWKKEIDYIVKKKLNLMMLRIGLDDLFQKAFPEDVKYPKAEGMLEGAKPDSYDDRSLFWDLQYRGELRKKVMDYAFERELIQPEDIGTPTHWYSSTPVDFLENKKPDLLVQQTKTYSEQVNSVFDIRKKRNFDYYMHLAETHVKEYGRPDMFHTIGLAERSFYDDKESNLKLKMFAYHKVISYLKEHYPNSPLLIASWDLWNQQWEAEQVQHLFKELDPNQAILFDYTSDTGFNERNFIKWGVVNKFPWIAGIFHAFEATTDVLGNYDLIKNRLDVAFNDDYCKGLVLWPENSHTDTFMLEYFTASAWQGEAITAEELLVKFCKDRYSEKSDEMLNIWQSFFPMLKSKSWDLYSPEYYNMFMFDEIPDCRIEACRLFYDKMLPIYTDAKELLNNLSNIDHQDNEFIIRDIIDIAKSVSVRFMLMTLLEIKHSKWAVKDGKESETGRLKQNALATLELIDITADLLGVNEEYSLFHSLERLKTIHTVNKDFETTLKANAFNDYCRTLVYETMKYLQADDLKVYFDSSFSYLEGGEEFENSKELYTQNIEDFKKKTLTEMAPPMKIDQLSGILLKLSKVASEFKFEKLIS